MKVDAVRALGAEVVLEGERLPEAAAHARTLAAERGMRFVDPGNEPAMIHGHATVYLELLQAHPEIAEVVIPIGSGSGAAGACLVRDVIAPHVRIIGVQAVGAPAAYESWVGEAEVSREANTRVSGLATGCGFATPQSVLRGSRGTAGMSDSPRSNSCRTTPSTTPRTCSPPTPTCSRRAPQLRHSQGCVLVRSGTGKRRAVRSPSSSRVAMSALTSGSGSRAGDASLDGAPQAMGAKHPRWEGYEAPTERVLLPSAEMLPSVSRPASGRGRGSTRGLRVNRSHSP